MESWSKKNLKPDFLLQVDNLQWINGMADDPKDLCCHGNMVVRIGGCVLERYATVSAAALYFLKTLTEDHMIYEDNQMMPCCGHLILPNEDGKTVTICGCPNGVDWTVHHVGDDVKMILEDGKEVTIPLEKYKEQVFAFADKIEAYYNACTTKELPKDEWERDAYLMFWEEWHRRRFEKI